MSSKLHIADNFSFPLEFITQTQAILAIKRIGKSYTASVQAEELLKAGQQIVAIDVTGAWWGLRSNATGDGPGFPIVIFGGDHGDIPLEETAGEVIADAIVTERFSAIIDLSLLRKRQAQRFLADFFETIYRRNREAMHLFMDEADFYAPQKPFGDEARTLGAVNDIVRRGGIRGIGCTLITQRASVLNKDVLTQAGIVTALRVSHPRDIKAILEWIDVHATREDAAEMLRTLPSLPKGDAWVWSPGWPTEKGIHERIHIRQRVTFDSGATPKAGHIVKQPKVKAEVDLTRLGEQIASTVQRQRDNDPTELKRRIAVLKKQLEEKPSADSVDIKQQIDIAVADVSRNWHEQWQNRNASLATIAESLRSAIDGIAHVIESLAKESGSPQPIIATAVNQQKPRTFYLNREHELPRQRRSLHSSDNGSAELTRPQLKLIEALAEAESIGRNEISRSWLAFIAGVSPTSSAFVNNLSRLSSLGYVRYPRQGLVEFTEKGKTASPSIDRPLTADELFARIIRLVSRPQSVLLEVLRSNYPRTLSRDNLADLADVSDKSSAFVNNLSALSSRELVEYPERGLVKLRDWVVLR